MTYEDLTYEKADGVVTICLNRPDKLNAARVETHDELLTAFTRADEDDEVRAVVVTGNGRAFCAGTDLSGGFNLPSGGDPATGENVPADLGGRVSLRLYEMRKPVIGAINGVAVGFGATVLLPMDFRIAASEARFGFIFSRRGIVAESCSSWFLPRLVGIATALDWMITGRMIPADEALERGLLHKVVAQDQLLSTAMALARDIADNTAPVSVALNRQLLWKMLGADRPRIAHDLESRALSATLALPDSREGARAFTEKRPAAFSGRTSEAAFMDAWWQQR
ncbi:enoyl-CoA hydratase-related protein [Rhodoligotrophos defluvii]|uniref:enoyl-CoA hydratase-related protein n=1 Tax=Rhodoligotrophos defluvii TaxID=2561934 RepID=UPI0010C9427B|nr:enoyl-CoA hydratase-related protein [Rhodoligotrophos defluvii]